MYQPKNDNDKEKALEEKIEEFFTKNQKYLGVFGFHQIILASKEVPEKAAKWRRKLVGFIQKNPIDATFPKQNIESHLRCLASYYLDKKQFPECFNLLDKNSKFISLKFLGGYAYNFFIADCAHITPLMLEKSREWLIAAALTKEPESILDYMDVVKNKHLRNIFARKQPLSLSKTTLIRKT